MTPLSALLANVRPEWTWPTVTDETADNTMVDTDFIRLFFLYLPMYFWRGYTMWLQGPVSLEGGWDTGAGHLAKQ